MALIQSLVRKGVVDDCVGEYGHLIVDECHHLSAQSFEQVARRAKAKFVAGLSATVARKDGHHPIIFMQCGPVRYRVNAKAQAVAEAVRAHCDRPPHGFPARTAVRNRTRRIQFQLVYQELIEDEGRNQRICDDVDPGRPRGPFAARPDRAQLSIWTRSRRSLPASIRHLVVLRGGMGRKETEAVTERLARDPATMRIASSWQPGKYIGEGFDDPRLDTLFLTLPVSWRGTVAQYVGRLHRLHDGKREVRVYDYADLERADAGANVRSALPRLRSRRIYDRPACGRDPGMACRRSACLPIPRGSATTRPACAGLSATGSTRRWRALFADAARPFSPDDEGADRARSATEAFLYRRLETLPETRTGRFG